MIGRMVASSRFFVLIATVSLFLAFMAVMVSTLVSTAFAIASGLTGNYSQNEMIGKLIKQADYALLATVLYVLALGLYSLFVDDRIPMPSWLRIHDLGHLKELLAGVVVVAIAVIFLGLALTWDGKSDMLALGRWVRRGDRGPALVPVAGRPVSGASRVDPRSGPGTAERRRSRLSCSGRRPAARPAPRPPATAGLDERRRARAAQPPASSSAARRAGRPPRAGLRRVPGSSSFFCSSLHAPPEA